MMIITIILVSFWFGCMAESTAGARPRVCDLPISPAHTVRGAAGGVDEGSRHRPAAPALGRAHRTEGQHGERPGVGRSFWRLGPGTLKPRHGKLNVSRNGSPKGKGKSPQCR